MRHRENQLICHWQGLFYGRAVLMTNSKIQAKWWLVFDLLQKHLHRIAAAASFLKNVKIAKQNILSKCKNALFMIGFHLFKDFKIQFSAVSLGSIKNIRK